MTEALPLWGVDFSSAPSSRKPITVAQGWLHRGTVVLERVQALPSLPAFESLLNEPGPWLGAFDFPFGLPRPFVQAQGLGDTLAQVVPALHRRWPTRLDFRAAIDAWGNLQPPGQRLLHRQCDRLGPGLSSTSPLQTRYVPVGFMFYEGVRRLLESGVHLPGLHEPAGAAGAVSATQPRLAVEGYPGLLAHELLGRRSYKNGDSADHRAARREILAALEAGRTHLAVSLQCRPALRRQLLSDPAGDHLDAVLCLMQAAWAAGQPRWGQPERVDPLEGWICTAPVPAGT